VILSHYGNQIAVESEHQIKIDSKY